MKLKERTCGECVTCCVYLSIDDPELKKEGMRHCSYVDTHEPEEIGKIVCYTGRGCSIYGKHPAACKGYLCSWRQGHGEKNDRPDRCGVLIDRVKKIEGAIECKPVWDGAADERIGREAIERISRSTRLVGLVTSFYERRLVRVVGRPVA